jgi:hypothetical protein
VYNNPPPILQNQSYYQPPMPSAAYNLPQTQYNQPTAPYNLPQIQYNQPTAPYNKQIPISYNQPQIPYNQPQMPINPQHIFTIQQPIIFNQPSAPNSLQTQAPLPIMGGSSNSPEPMRMQAIFDLYIKIL